MQFADLLICHTRKVVAAQQASCVPWVVFAVVDTVGFEPVTLPGSLLPLRSENIYIQTYVVTYSVCGVVDTSLNSQCWCPGSNPVQGGYSCHYYSGEEV